MKLTITLGLLMMLCLTLVGCGLNKDAEVKAFVSEFDKVTNDMAAKINADSSEKGVEEAQKIWDSNKASLKTKFNAFKEARGIQITESVQKDMEKGLTKNAETMTGLISKLEDPGAMQKFTTLLTDYGNLLQDK